ncbi:MAG: hypothetical protein N3E41_07585 [Thermofilaceae archaeon]|nr:hypothetical protein [Thermofilaceae archaeon]
MRYLIAFIYAQVINLVETFIWVGHLWGLKPPFPTTQGDVRNDGYHTVLAIFYVVPYALTYCCEPLVIATLSTLTWLLNDIMWHIWSVNPRYHLHWLRFYFNPHSNQVVWYARFGFFKIAVTPKRMFRVTVLRIIAVTFLIATCEGILSFIL